MGCFAETMLDRRDERECLPEDFGAWCVIEDLCGLCGYDAAGSFSVLRDIAVSYPARSGRTAEEDPEAHPMEALARAVGRYLAEYPEEAERRLAEAAAAAGPMTEKAGRRPVIAA